VSTTDLRVKAVTPGPIDTEMLTRLTDSIERKADMLSTVPLRRAGTPEQSPRPMSSSDRASQLHDRRNAARQRRQDSVNSPEQRI
jgi:NAD(P)-dependent dehydrogenase (short-subunit alcohol dehydrogenase family)